MEYVSYIRVSTKQQQISNLGIESQKLSIKNFITSNDVLIKEFVEIESGKNNNRPVLNNAIEFCKNNNAILLIAKLDRLSRNVYFISSLLESNIKFKAIDLPECDNFTIHIFSALAQKERELISQRTKSALAQKKLQGVKLGNPENLTDKARLNSIATKQSEKLGNDNWKRSFLVIDLLRKQGLSLRKIATKINDGGFRTRENKLFTAAQVSKVLNMYSSTGI